MIMRKSVCKDDEVAQLGFTLIEMMATVAVMAIIMAIAINAYSGLMQRNRVESAAESMRSALTAARIHAISTGQSQYVTVNFVANNTALADSFTTTFWGGSYVSARSKVEGAERTVEGGGVDWINGSGGVSSCAASAAADKYKTIEFRKRGTAGAESDVAGTPTYTWIVQDSNGGNRFCFVVNNVTGRVWMGKL